MKATNSKFKVFSIVLAIILICSFAILLTACGGDEDKNGDTNGNNTPIVPDDNLSEHVHIWETTYSSNDSFHWFSCTKCDEYKNRVLHSYDNNKCVCGHMENIGGLIFKLNDDGNSYNVADVDATYDEEITIPSTYAGKPVIGIGDSAIAGRNVTKVVIPNSVTSIGYCAFSHCRKLESIVIPNSVTFIGEAAFVQCPKLKNITLSNNLESISRLLFAECTSISNIVIPNKVSIIEDSAFSGCTSLTSVTIGNSVKEIWSSIFLGCKAINTINYLGSKTEWNAIHKTTSWFGGNMQCIISCSDGIVTP